MLGGKAEPRPAAAAARRIARRRSLARVAGEVGEGAECEGRRDHVDESRLQRGPSVLHKFVRPSTAYGNGTRNDALRRKVSTIIALVSELTSKFHSSTLGS